LTNDGTLVELFYQIEGVRWSPLFI
jgi:hypothetical protein